MRNHVRASVESASSSRRHAEISKAGASKATADCGTESALVPSVGKGSAAATEAAADCAANGVIALTVT